MTYRWIDDQGLLRKVLGERRVDPWTAAIVNDALRARSTSAAANRLAYRRVDIDIALRVLSKPEQRRRQDP
jgi:hypothetical protein